ncbi:UNVERIFIED_CONTAM: hypothetical protein PYX00_008536 [Menopon gallinae]|uniref:Peroxidase n=1 Tax=Menopon gallinae TaxID=328185 RepID=A0AAW2HNL5_9NEOP
MKRMKLSWISVLALFLVSSIKGDEAANKTKRSFDQVAQPSIDQFSGLVNNFQPGYSSVFFSTPKATFMTQQAFIGGIGNTSPATQYGPNYYQTVLAQNGPIQCISVTRNCKFLKYRTFDGTCNNLKNPSLGAANTVFTRLVPPKYSDGIYKPPLSWSGKPLPNARLISVAVFPDVNLQDPQLTLAAMQWGQIMTHDMALATGTTFSDQLSAPCCSQDGRTVTTEGLTARYCFPILVPEEDPLYKKYQQGCLNFARTLTDQDVGCGSQYKPAEQIVSVTHFLDASNVYGSNDDIAASLRTFEGGRLIVEYRNGAAWPPMNVNRTTACPVMRTTVDVCYMAGDVRVNQNTQLTVLQVLLLREHNRIADQLAHINPHWNDEIIYQEARKIVIAEVQFISYYEWLPIFFGTQNLMNYGIIYDPLKNIYINDYNEHVDPRVINEHSTGAFRAFHTNIQGFLKLITEERHSKGAVRLSDYFNNPSILEYGDNFNDLTRGLATQPQQASDQYHTVEITDFLFRDNQPFGFDLKAIDVQRGRDHGLPSYNTMREYCGLKRAEHFEDFMDYIPFESVQKLRSLYEHPDDVDLNVGGLLESLLPGTLSGPTYLCIMLEQFYRTRVGDRFFFENAQHEGAFSPEQLMEIKKTSLARLMCDNGNEIFSIQPRAFVKISDANPIVPCNDIQSIPIVNLNAWKDFGGKGAEGFSTYFFK